jgi:pyrroline-5-carboxylate reductase
MPNLPAEILKGVTAVKENKRVEPKQSKNLALLLEAFGETVKFVEEKNLMLSRQFQVPAQPTFF